MSISRLLAISAIFILASLAWLALGTSLVARTGEFDSRLGQEVAQLWGGEHRQVAPRVWVERPRQVTERVSDGVRDGQVVMRTSTRTITDQGAVPLAQSRGRRRPRALHPSRRAADDRHRRLCAGLVVPGLCVLQGEADPEEARKRRRRELATLVALGRCAPEQGAVLALGAGLGAPRRARRAPSAHGSQP